MNGASLLLISGTLLSIAYFTYGKKISRWLGVDNKNITPAHSMNDGVDYFPAKTPVLLGHHFASIAGAGPIIGPILAVYFGWAPAFLWIIVGGIFMGAMHDYVTLISSVRHQGRSIGGVIESYIGLKGKKLFLIFAWSALLLVIAIFMNAVVAAFMKFPPAGVSSILFIFLAVAFGFVTNKNLLSFRTSTLIGLVFIIFSVKAGLEYPFELSENTWLILIVSYISVASVTPVWILLQPRDYLNSFLLYGIMILAVLGIFFYQVDLKVPAMTSFHTEIGYLFPMLFVTVACGAISGFHSLVATGTTSKQLDKETDARMVGYGSMLIESFLAVIALITAAYLSLGDYKEFIPMGGGKADPIGLFSSGIGTFTTSLGLSYELGSSFAALAISAFALTTLDTSVRLSRYTFQEFFTQKGEKKPSILSTNRYLATGISVGGGSLFAFSGGAGALWPLFGSANQLLAAIALLAVSVWLTKTRRSSLFVRIPMFFMFSFTLVSLMTLFYKNLVGGNLILSAFSIALVGVSFVLAYQAYTSLTTEPKTPVPVDDVDGAETTVSSQ